MDFMAAQEGFAAAIIADNPYDSWERIVVDVEILGEDGGHALNTVCFAVVHTASDKLKIADITLSDATRQAAIALYRERLDNAGVKIGSFGLEIDRGGECRVKLSYDKPERLTGNLDGEKTVKLNNYLATYQPTQ
jgi:hypothetical protein